MSNSLTFSKIIHNKREFYFLIFIFVLALTLRLAYVWLLKMNYIFYGHPSSDVTYYLDWANQIARGEWVGGKTFYGLPLFPYFLAVLKGLCLGNLALMHLAYILLGSLNCVLIYYVSRRAFSEIIAQLAAFLTAINFTLIHFDWLMMPVTLLITLSLIIILSLMYRENLKTKHEWFILGLLIGLATQGDGKFLIFLVFLGLYFLKVYFQKCDRQKLKLIFSLFCGACLIIFGVALRNKIVGGNWVMASAQSGLSFYVGNNPEATGVFENPEFIRPTHGGQDIDQGIVARALTQRSLTDSEISKFWKQKAVDFIRQHPEDYAKLLGHKFILFFTETEYAHDIDLILQRAWRERFDINPFILICPLGFLGMSLAWYYRRENIFMNFLIVSQLMITLIFFLTTRHRVTILPLLIIYEAYALGWVVEQFKIKHWEKILIPIVCVAIYLLLVPPQFLNNRDFAFLQHTKLGPIYDQRREFTKASHEYAQALSLRPEDSNTLYNVGTSFLLQEKIPAAQYYFKKTLAMTPYNVDALFNLGYTYEITKQFDLAISFYQQVLQYQSDSPDIYYRLGTVYQKKRDCPAAKKYYSIISQQRPQLQEEINKLIAQCR